MKQFRCGDLMPGCPTTFTGTRDDVLAQAARHFVDDHKMSQVDPGLLADVENHLAAVA